MDGSVAVERERPRCDGGGRRRGAGRGASRSEMEVGSPTSGGASDVDVFGSDADPRGGSAGRGCAGSARGDAGGQGGGRGCGGGGGGGGAVALELVSIGDGASGGGARAKVAARGGPAGGAASQGDGATLILRLYASRVRVVFAVRHPGSVAMDDGESPSEKIVARAKASPRAMPGTSIGTRTSSLSRVARTTARFLSRSCSCTGKSSAGAGALRPRGGPRRGAARTPHRRRSPRRECNPCAARGSPSSRAPACREAPAPRASPPSPRRDPGPSPRPRRATRSGLAHTQQVQIVETTKVQRHTLPAHAGVFCAFEQFFPGAARHSPRFSSSRAASAGRALLGAARRTPRSTSLPLGR